MPDNWKHALERTEVKKIRKVGSARYSPEREKKVRTELCWERSFEEEALEVGTTKQGIKRFRREYCQRGQGRKTF